MQNNLMKAAIALAAVATLATACNSTDEDYQPASNTETKPEARTFSIEIPATINGNNSLSKSMSISNDDSPSCRFEASEKVYVFNRTQSEYLTGTLSPTNISSDGLSCVISGEVTGTIEANDELEFYYNANSFNQNYNRFSCNYDNQTGTKSNLLDAGMATDIKVESVNNGKFTLDKNPDFKMMQSMFKFKFVSNNQPVNVKKLIISSLENSVYAFYNPYYSPGYGYEDVSMFLIPNSPTSDYLYAALCIRESWSSSSDALSFTVLDDNDVLYTVAAAAPTGGFKNGNYYYKNQAIALTKFGQLPNVVGTNLDEETTGFTKDEDYVYYVAANKFGDPCVFTISGTSTGCMFNVPWGGTVTLDNLTATYYNDLYMYVNPGSLTLNIKGDNSIKCNYQYCFGTVELKGKGTLTLTATNATAGGLYSYTVADGYSVTRSDRVDNSDGTYSWTYTIESTR